MTDIIVRKMPFEFPDDIQAHWCPTRPEWSHMVNGASLAMPYLEPYLIRTMRKAHKQLDSDALKIDLQHYMAQEGQHYQQHRKFNDQLINNGYEDLKDIEAEMATEFASFEKERSLKFNVAYACGFETMALGIAHWLINNREELFAESDKRVSSLILWHFIEEIEHKNVAFDVYQTLYGGFFYRLYATIFAALHVIKFSRKAYQTMLKKDGLWTQLSSRWRLFKMSTRFIAALAPTLIKACLPNHHPSDIKNPLWYEQWLAAHKEDPSLRTLFDT